MYFTRKLLVAFALVAAFILFYAKTTAAEIIFNPNSIISDEEMLDSKTMTKNEIQAFLLSKNSYLATYSCANYAGVTKTAAEIIYEAANNHKCENIDNPNALTREQKDRLCEKVTINPRVLLVLLQKEQSLVENKNPSQRALDWATGYGCPDNQACNPRWQGFGKQVNSASLQFYDYVMNPQRYNYKAGHTYTVTNTGRPPSVITPVNNATAALYNYTPHVYNGNYNFYNLWLRYFTFNYPNNTLMQVKGEPGVWLIQNGQKRPFITRGALTSRYDPEKVIPVNKNELDRYPTGQPIKFAQYSLIRSPRGTIFLIVDDKRRGFASAEAFRLIGINPEEVTDAGWEDINAYEEGEPITESSVYPTGALLQDKSTGGVYYVVDGTKAPLWDSVLLKTRFRNRSITPETPEKLAAFTTVEPAIFHDGELLKSNAGPAVYVIDQGAKRPVASGELFEKLGYRWSNIIIVPPKILALYPEGAPLKEIYSAQEIGEAEIVPESETAYPENGEQDINEDILDYDRLLPAP